jgi:uncharacterized OB-fold protein
MNAMQRMAEYASRNQLALQHCAACGTVQYPPRELCCTCLADQLQWRASDAEGGEVLATTLLHHSHEHAFRDTLPLRVGLVRLDPGPTVVCFLTAGCDAGTPVRVTARNDAAGRPVLTAMPSANPPVEDPPRAATATPSR